MKKQSSLKKIEDVRLKNNTNTINILRLAFRHSPIESKKILLRVNEWDDKISILLKELTNKNHRDIELILNNLEQLRAENNKWWMQMIDIAFKSNPQETTKLMEQSDNYSIEVEDLINKI